MQGGGGLFALGMGMLGGTATISTTAALAAGFSAGFIGVWQGIANALDIQDGLDLKGAPISGLANAGVQSQVSGTHFNAADILTDSLGSAIGNSLVSATTTTKTTTELVEERSLEQELVRI